MVQNKGQLLGTSRPRLCVTPPYLQQHLLNHQGVARALGDSKSSGDSEDLPCPTIFLLGLTVTGAILGSQDRLLNLSLASFPGLVSMGPGADIA